MSSSIAKALVSATKSVKSPTFDKSNAHFAGYRYASLAAHIEAVKPGLAAHGISVVQKIASAEDGRLSISTALVHESGEREECSITLPMPGRAQEIMSLCTYMRRAQLAALVCVAGDDDDDANTASPKPEPKPVAKPERSDAELSEQLETIRRRHGVEAAMSGKRKPRADLVSIVGTVSAVYEKPTKTGVIYKIKLEDGPDLKAWPDLKGVGFISIGHRYEFKCEVKESAYGVENTIREFEVAAPSGSVGEAGEEIPF